MLQNIGVCVIFVIYICLKETGGAKIVGSAVSKGETDGSPVRTSTWLPSLYSYCTHKINYFKSELVVKINRTI